MLHINLHGFDSPDRTYFRVEDAQPEIRVEQGQPVLKLVNGTGTRRKSWGEPAVTSTVIVQDEDLVSIHVGFFHKHGGGQFYRYYVPSEQGYKQVMWTALSDDLRARVLDAAVDRAPSWAKDPGKLRKDRKPVEIKKIETYKIVQVIAGRMFSVFDSTIEYSVGKRMTEAAAPHHEGGFYSFPHLEGLMDRFENQTLFPEKHFDRSMSLAVLRCEASGSLVQYGQKYCTTYLRPIEVINTFEYTPASEQAAS